jgi:hypothetical protein
MKHDKSFVRDFIHVLGRVGDVKVDEPFFVKVDSNGVDQLYNKVFDGGVFLFLFFVLEEGISEEQVVRGFDDKAVDVLFVDESGNE